jgi:Tfp pilus assembly protein PilF
MLLTPGLNKKHLVLLGIFGLILLGTVIYLNILHAPFVYDDRGTIVENETIRNLSCSFAGLTKNRSIGFLSFAFNYAIGELNVFGYHVFNNLIHVINALLVYYFVTLILRTPRMRDTVLKKDFIAFSAAFIFVSHPLQTQAVTYITQRFTILATFFYLLSLVLYIKTRLKQTSGFDMKGKGNFLSVSILPFYILFFISAIFAMKTKEISLTLPLAIIMCEIYCFGLENKKLIRLVYLLPIFLTLFLIPLAFLDFGKSFTDILSDVDHLSRETVNISRKDYFITQFMVIITYIKLLLFPVHQNLDHDYPVYHTIFSTDILLSLLSIIFIAAIAIWTYKREKLVSFGIVWFFLTLSIESGIIPIRDVMNEHRVYLPSIGFFIASVTVADRFIPVHKIKVWLVVTLVRVLSAGTINRNMIWRNPQTLWEDVIAKAPNNARAYNNLGVVYKERGEFDMAIEQFKKSIETDKNYTAVYYNLGDVQYRLGNYERAIAYLEEALTGKLGPWLHLDILNKLGRTYSAMGQTDKAIEIFEKAVKLFPSSIILLNNLGVQYIKSGQPDSAIEIYETAIKIEKKSYLYKNLAVAYAKGGDEEKSRLMYQKALE